ncbi:sigma-70 family RNA polymerase sigma factor [Nonomuraea sp. NBC_01738]|uniref:RNA polymerase sigma factor n=1 Tax=Nonomuraea sp. NBC_01738 TaxID=2976003 RepID=UPI002E139F81|nr:sigma-70 family RNA polymerase sigma factor [Nonomuraea sp. NBC_01738]
MSDPRSTAVLLKDAADGDRDAWDSLVARFGPRMWSVARACGLADADAADAVQGAWLRLLESLDAIREPESLGAWLVTTTRRLAIRVNLDGRVLCPQRHVGDSPPDPASACLEADAVRRLWQAVSDLHEPCRTVLTLAAQSLGTHQLSVRAGIPVGSVGPTKIRCLRQLRTLISEEKAQ